MQEDISHEERVNACSIVAEELVNVLSKTMNSAPGLGCVTVLMLQKKTQLLRLSFNGVLVCSNYLFVGKRIEWYLYEIAVI